MDKVPAIDSLSKDELARLIADGSRDLYHSLCQKARETKEKAYGTAVYLRGLIEFTNHCKNDCYYCGIRRSNSRVHRYRLTEEEILSCCAQGYALGFRTFVLQGGEDAYFTDQRLCGLIRSIKAACPDCAVTLSVGERSAASYQALRSAGADRYLLRHETATPAHYRALHPREMHLDHRMDCLSQLKKLGFQTGAGFMVGSPGQTAAHLAEDLLYLKQLRPEMVGIGPFIPQRDTPFAKEAPGSVSLTIKMVALTRLLLPHALIPATTALGTLSLEGREKALLSGANVLMPNLTPAPRREDYALYDNKASVAPETAENLQTLKDELSKLGLTVDMGRGDCRC